MFVCIILSSFCIFPFGARLNTTIPLFFPHRMRFAFILVRTMEETSSGAITLSSPFTYGNVQHAIGLHMCCFSTMELMGVTVVRPIDGQYQSNIIITTITPIKTTFYCHFIDPLPSGKLLHNYGKSPCY